MNKNELIGNLTTIIKAFSMIIAGWVIGLFASKGLQLPVTQTDIATAITTILFIILAFLDARYPNTILDKTSKQESTVTIVTTDELSEAITKATQETIEEEVDEVDVGDDQQ